LAYQYHSQIITSLLSLESVALSLCSFTCSKWTFNIIDFNATHFVSISGLKIHCQICTANNSITSVQSPTSHLFRILVYFKVNYYYSHTHFINNSKMCQTFELLLSYGSYNLIISLCILCLFNKLFETSLISH
jgi:hypothetical protein